jgi:hypothetical protein
MSRSLGKPILVGASSVVIMSVVAGIIIIGSPVEGRFQQLDSGRVEDFRVIMHATDLFWSRNRRLPSSLDELAADPDSGQPYAYEQLGDERYELCATFDRASVASPVRPIEEFWQHVDGHQCFEVDVDKAIR